MAYVRVDLDMDELETYELVDEVVKRLKSARSRKQLTKEQKSQLKEAITDLNEELNCISDRLFPNKTLEDRQKVDVIIAVWDKYTSWQMEEKLK